RFKTIRGARKCRAVMEFTLAFAMFAADYHRAAGSGRSTEFSSPRACGPRASVTTYSKSWLGPGLPGKRWRIYTVHGEHFVHGFGHVAIPTHGGLVFPASAPGIAPHRCAPGARGG